jgi:hypothetical protein
MWPGEGFFSDAWNHTKSSFVGTFSNIKKVLTTNPVTTAKGAYHSFMEKSIGGKVEAYFNLFPGSHMIISEAKAIKAAVKGDGKGVGDFVGSQAANTVTVVATDGVLSAASKGFSALSSVAKSLDSGFGPDLSGLSKPSTLTPGPFAGESIPARGPGRDFTQAERDAINQIGSETGCHTCGVTTPGTKSGNFILDHQPPSALVEPGTAQDLYPHCTNCSPRQGGEVRVAKNKQN